MKTLRDTIYSLLENNEKYVKLVDDKKQVNIFAVKNDIINLDKDLLKVLFNDETTKEAFFVNIDSNYVFDKDKFMEVLNTRLLDDSYTKFKNKVDLINENGKFISDSNEIVLSYPYKDCILEGGQEKEVDKDGKKIKRKEIFYNPLIAEKETKLMMAPKVFVNAKRWTKDGVEENIENFNDDNLIIKGNNLLALSSLLKRYEGKIKLIYIDPPYYFNNNKDSDAFNYNSNFKLSTWLVFMKDRLKIAYDLLDNNGVMLCHIGEDGYAWLKILMLEIFDENDFVETFIWKNTDNADSLSKKSRASVEYIICFEKKKNSSTKYIGKTGENGDSPIMHTNNNIHSLVFPPKSIKFNISDGLYKKGVHKKSEIIEDFIVKNGTNIDKVILKGEFTWSQETLDEELLKGSYIIIKTNDFSVRCQKVEAAVLSPEKYIDNEYLSKDIGIGTNEDATTHLSNMGIDFKYSKPESIVAFFIRAMTQENDTVLDFFLGSGTTCAVAQKMNRKYIGIEQLDYIETKTIKRLQKVLDGEDGGVSKSVNWQGGGSFVYCELAKNNQHLVENIENAEDDNKLNEFLEIINKTQYINVKVRIKDVIDNKKEFDELTFEEKKRFLIELLDKNQLYVNYDDIDDEEFNISDSDKKFTKSFYNVEE